MASWTAFGKLHGWIYRVSGGRLGARAGGVPMLMLTTRGRRSGAERSVVLAYLSDGDDLVVVASNSGSDRHPAWWYNLRDAPDATVQVGPATHRVRAALATPAERARLWPVLKATNPFYARYERGTKREIPVVILRAVS
jgi:deazaflavin-dependent oxidoreductase (nitroreductase family)